MYLYHEEPVIGEWQTDENGRRFRRVGNSIEYATRITTTRGTYYEDDVKAGILKKVAPADPQEAAPQTRKCCPFKKGLNPVCSDRCVFYSADGCAFKGDSGVETEGRYCPFTNGPCKDTCALYENTCTLTVFKMKG